MPCRNRQGGCRLRHDPASRALEGYTIKYWDKPGGNLPNTHTITYPASTGRKFDEVLRVLDSLQLTARYQVATPVNWKHGEDVIIVPSISNEEAKQKFPLAGRR